MMEGVARRYTFKLYPSKGQADALDTMRRLHCHLYNAALQERIDAYRLAGKSLTHFDQGKSIKIIRADDAAYEAMSADSMSYTLKRLDLAFQSFFRRAKAGAGAQSGFPRYKRSADYPGFTHRPDNGWRFDVRPGDQSGRTYIKGIPGTVKWRGKFPMFPYAIKTGDVMVRAGSWWLSVVADMPAQVEREAELNGEVEFDLVDSFARVRCADGGLAAGSEETVYAAANGRITPVCSVGCAEAPADTPATGGDHRACRAILGKPADTAQTGGDHGGLMIEPAGRQADTPATGGDHRVCLPRAHFVGPADIPQTTEQTESDHGCERPTRRPPADTPQLQRSMSKTKRGSCRYRALKLRLARQEARRARQRRESQHVWTTGLARRFKSLKIICPPIRETTGSGAGKEHEWGAAVDLKAKLNRRMLDQAPAAAIAMLEYKIAQRGGTTTIIRPIEHKAEVGNLIVEATKQTRKLRRTARAR